MMIQRMTVKASNMSKEKAAARLKSHLKYLQYRQHNQEQEETKTAIFSMLIWIILISVGSIKA